MNILFGADVFAAILQVGVQKSGPGDPVAQKTSLGWMVSGSITSSRDKDSGTTAAHQCVTLDELINLVKRF